MALTVPTTTITASSTGSLGDPITTSAPWRTYSVNGTPAPGILARDGVRGFARETGWDRKKGKGQQGATLTLVQQPPVEGTMVSWLWLPSHFTAWESFVDLLLTYQVGKVSNQQAATIDYPELALLNVTNVVVAKVFPRRHVGRNLWEVAVEYIEWVPPPTKSIVATPIKANTVVAPDLPGTPPPDVAAAHAQYMQSQADHAAAAGAP